MVMVTNVKTRKVMCHVLRSIIVALMQIVTTTKLLVNQVVYVTRDMLGMVLHARLQVGTKLQRRYTVTVSFYI